MSLSVSGGRSSARGCATYVLAERAETMEGIKMAFEASWERWSNRALLGALATGTELQFNMDYNGHTACVYIGRESAMKSGNDDMDIDSCGSGDIEG